MVKWQKQKEKNSYICIFFFFFFKKRKIKALFFTFILQELTDKQNFTCLNLYLVRMLLLSLDTV